MNKVGHVTEVLAPLRFVDAARSEYAQRLVKLEMLGEVSIAATLDKAGRCHSDGGHPADILLRLDLPPSKNDICKNVIPISETPLCILLDPMSSGPTSDGRR